MLKISHLLRSVDLWLRKCMLNLALVYCAAGRVSPLRLAHFTHFLTQKSTPLSTVISLRSVTRFSLRASRYFGISDILPLFDSLAVAELISPIYSMVYMFKYNLE